MKFGLDRFYRLLALDNKKMKQLYKDYCETELKKNPRKVKDNLEMNGGSVTPTDTFYSATFCNQPRAECWLRDDSSEKKPDRDHVCHEIAKIGNIMVMQWAHQQGFPWDEATCACATEHGHLELLQWLHANGCPWDVWTCTKAAENGHLEILQWLRENGCPWDVRTCEGAAENGHLEVLKWARANDCPWDELTCEKAAENGHLEF
ncbi:ankyrin containing protein (ISS) [Seminavis robusta]|uniref:Ankyrin containing protein (ISS) n=1 Tax=Seminavis robusta TaxID=568900 RepID=A0A9N8F549_9STRA|nr:ankyrin containing protein (ISS) [Seminavis robusta]|eukprot:Sro4069_g352740.1 ankyrin containing protein (ISS) (205) ;mRNA; f:1872-2486